MFDLSTLVKEAVEKSDEPDPHVIARRLLLQIPEEHLREALGETLPAYVRIRGVQPARSGETAGEPGRPGGSPKPGNNRWGRARWSVNGEWKFERDLTADDCDAIAEDYAQRAAQNAAMEAKFRARAEQLRASGKHTLGEFDDDLGLAA